MLLTTPDDLGIEIAAYILNKINITEYRCYIDIRKHAVQTPYIAAHIGLESTLQGLLDKIEDAAYECGDYELQIYFETLQDMDNENLFVTLLAINLTLMTNAATDDFFELIQLIQGLIDKDMQQDGNVYEIAFKAQGSEKSVKALSRMNINVINRMKAQYLLN